jgi:hypothetical protein
VLSRTIASLCLVAALCPRGSAQAQVLDFESFDLMGGVFLDTPETLLFPDVSGSGIDVRIEGHADIRIYDLDLFAGDPLAVGQALIDWPWPMGSNPAGTDFHFEPTVRDVSLRAGDYYGDIDSPLQIVAYDCDGAVLAQVSQPWPSTAGPPFTTLVLNVSGIARVHFSSGGPFDNSVFVDDLTFTPDGGSCTTGTPVCFGDGSGAPCGCGNEAPSGSGSGCLNELGVGATLSASGTADTANDTLVLTADGVTDEPGVFFQGDMAIGGGAGLTFGDGLRCCGQNTIRLEIVDPAPTPNPTSASTSASISQHPSQGPLPGTTKCYQYWYRDSGSSPCGSAFNLSNALLIGWI